MPKNKKILIDGTNRAYGVEYDWHGKTEFAYAHREVILSAGAMMSPQLLMLSGIGPKKHLQDLGVTNKFLEKIYYIK